MTVLINPDKFRMRAPGALRFVDASNLETVNAGLKAAILDPDHPAITHDLAARGAGYWVAERLSGVPAFLPPLALRTISDRQPVDPAILGQFPPEWAGTARDLEVRVEDTQNRFLPCRFDYRMPDPAQTMWAVWDSPPPARIRSILPDGASEAEYIPLFNRSGRSYDVPVARVAAHLAIRQSDGTDRAASWALLRVRRGNITVGLGLADENGNAEVAFPYPDLPTLSPADAATGRDEISWTISIAVHFDDLPVEVGSDGKVLPPKFDTIMDQLRGPATRTLQDINSSTAFPSTDLVLGQRLILRTLDGSNQPLSSLFLEAS